MRLQQNTKTPVLNGFIEYRNSYVVEKTVTQINIRRQQCLDAIFYCSLQSVFSFEIKYFAHKSSFGLFHF